MNGEVPFKLSSDEYNFIKEFYLAITTIFFEINHKRNNIPNCIFFIKKIINLLYTDIDETKRVQCNKLIFIQKQTTVNKISKIWSDIIKNVDVEQVRADFAQTIRDADKKKT